MSGQAVFAADDSISFSISPTHASFEVLPDEYGHTSQTISVSTNNPAGYKVSLSSPDETNALINTEDDSYTIPTFTLGQGQTSIPVANLGYGYGYSIDNGSNYLPIPAPTFVDEIFRSNAAGDHEHVLAFGAKVGADVPAGVYQNNVTIYFTVNAPEHIYDLVYDGNGSDDGDMDSATTTDVTVGDAVTLIAPNYNKDGYGFAGWSFDSNVNPLNPGTSQIYGPGEAITAPSFADYGVVEGEDYLIKLYAIWIKSDDILQNWTGCSALSNGESVALTDFRDGNAYTVTKLADGNCWMTENLRLDPSASKFSAANTNNGRGSYARYWSSTADPLDSNNAFRLGLSTGDVTPVRSFNKWDAFTARCIVKNDN